MTTETVAVAAATNNNNNNNNNNNTTTTTTNTPAAAAVVEGTTTPPDQPVKKNRIQVSNTKKPLFFYVNLAKKYIQQHNEVELSALGMAITTVVTIAEILKNNGFATEKKVLTSTVGMKDEAKGRLVQKARIEIVLGKTEKFDSLMNGNNNNNNAPATEANKKTGVAAEANKTTTTTTKDESKQSVA